MLNFVLVNEYLKRKTAEIWEHEIGINYLDENGPGNLKIYWIKYWIKHWIKCWIFVFRVLGESSLEREKEVRNSLVWINYEQKIVKFPFIEQSEKLLSYNLSGKNGSEDHQILIWILESF